MRAYKQYEVLLIIEYAYAAYEKPERGPAYTVLTHAESARAAEVVVSSSWREGRTLGMLEEILREAGFTGSVRGKTPTWLRDEGGARAAESRGGEIQAWLDWAPNYGVEVESFVILDDSPDATHLADRLVLTDHHVGLTMRDAERAAEMLIAPPQLLLVPTQNQVTRFGKNEET